MSKEKQVRLDRFFEDDPRAFIPIKKEKTTKPPKCVDPKKCPPKKPKQ